MSNSKTGSTGWASKGNPIKPWESPKYEIPRPQRVIEKGARLLHCQESSKVFEGIHNQLKKCDHGYYVKIHIVTCISLYLSVYLYMFHYMNIHWKDWCWSWSSHTLAIWCKELTNRKRLWRWERLRAEGEVGNRGRDGWVASPIEQTWVWANSRR